MSIWWRRRELNPGPKILRFKRLHAYPCFIAYRAGVPPGPGTTRTILLWFRPPGGRRARQAIPLVDALTGPVGVGRQDGSARCLGGYCVSIVVCDYIYSTGFTRWVETSACSLSLHIPVESVSPPCVGVFLCPVAGQLPGTLSIPPHRALHLAIGFLLLE